MCIQIWGLGIGDWGLGFGYGGLGIGPNPHPPIPNPQSPNPNYQTHINLILKLFFYFKYIKNKKYNIKKFNKKN